jgi:hypothetical protein
MLALRSECYARSRLCRHMENCCDLSEGRAFAISLNSFTEIRLNLFSLLLELLGEPLDMILKIR